MRRLLLFFCQDGIWPPPSSLCRNSRISFRQHYTIYTSFSGAHTRGLRRSTLTTINESKAIANEAAGKWLFMTAITFAADVPQAHKDRRRAMRGPRPALSTSLSASSELSFFSFSLFCQFLLAVQILADPPFANDPGSAFTLPWVHPQTASNMVGFVFLSRIEHGRYRFFLFWRAVRWLREAGIALLMPVRLCFAQVYKRNLRVSGKIPKSWPYFRNKRMRL